QGYNDDPPTRAGRIGFVQGSVSFQPGGTGDWLEAVPNRPLTVGDNLWVNRDSRAEIQLGSTSLRLGPETSITFLDLGNNVDQLAYDVESIGSRDPFDRWVMARDERQDRVRSSQYISTEMTGYEDLDDYGRWQNAGEYGNVWVPTGVPVGWAPYRYGHWAYVYPWGWTWIEDEPWGFAPFHYGRWAFISSNWCWVPGPVAVAPVYAPALVAFIGGGGFSVGIGVGGGGGVGWFPLARGEV